MSSLECRYANKAGSDNSSIAEAQVKYLKANHIKTINFLKEEMKKLLKYMKENKINWRKGRNSLKKAKN